MMDPFLDKGQTDGQVVRLRTNGWMIDKKMENGWVMEKWLDIYRS